MSAILPARTGVPYTLLSSRPNNLTVYGPYCNGMR